MQVSPGPSPTVAYIPTSHTDSDACVHKCPLHCPMTAPPLRDIHSLDLEILERTVLFILPLRRLRNSLIPIARVPDEILLQIFHLCVDDDDAAFSMKNQLSFSNVSHHWRDIAMADGSLWSFIDCSRPAATDNLIRSLPHPISVRIYPRFAKIGEISALEVFNQVLANRPGIKRLDMTLSDDDFFDYVDDMLHYVKPNLEGLEVFRLYRTTGYEAVSVDHFFPYGVPLSLKALRLNGCFIGWQYLETMSLTTLHVDVYEVDTPVDWRRVMVQLAPYLQDLRLGTDSVTTVSSGPVIHMACLHKVSFQLREDPFLSFLTYLRFPDHAEIIWDSDIESSWPQPRLPSLAAFLNSHFTRHTNVSSLSISFLYNRFSVASIGGQGKLVMNTFFIIHREIGPFIDSLDYFLRSCVSELCFYELEEDVEYGVAFPWQIMSWRFPSVSSIALITRPNPEFPGQNREDYHRRIPPRRLNSDLITSWATNKRSGLFPSVTDLCLRETRLVDTQGLGEQALLAALEERKRILLPITRIHLDERCSVSADMRRAIGIDVAVVLENWEIPFREYGERTWIGTAIKTRLRRDKEYSLERLKEDYKLPCHTDHY
jgi:hypothetical protein